MSHHDCDVLIVGGGLVGAALATALRRIPVRTVLVEARDPEAAAAPGADGRVIALANGSQRILEGLGTWSGIGAEAEPIRTIHVSERGRFGATVIDAREAGVDALGYTIEHGRLARAFWESLRNARGFTRLAPAALAEFSTEGGAVTARVRQGEEVTTVRARLLVGADGARSSVRAALGIDAREDDYAQQAVITTCTTEAPPRGRAFERFTATGPLALLPVRGERAAVVWTLDRDRAARAMTLDDEAFRARLQSAFGYRLGGIERVGRRALHGLVRVRSTALARRRALLIGNAAVNLHPVAGQSFNLALRDVAIVAELVADAVAAAGPDADIGARRLLERYREWRVRDQRRVAGLTHGLIRCFGLSAPGAGAARGLGLAIFDVAPGAKPLLARQTMGRAGRAPRLARGLGL